MLQMRCNDSTPNHPLIRASSSVAQDATCANFSTPLSVNAQMRPIKATREVLLSEVAAIAILLRTRHFQEVLSPTDI